MAHKTIALTTELRELLGVSLGPGLAAPPGPAVFPAGGRRGRPHMGCRKRHASAIPGKSEETFSAQRKGGEPLGAPEHAMSIAAFRSRQESVQPGARHACAEAAPFFRTAPSARSGSNRRDGLLRVWARAVFCPLAVCAARFPGSSRKPAA